jgi:uncharacterized protein YgiM (DUF1202 family)
MKQRLLIGLVLGLALLIIVSGVLAQNGSRPEAVITSNAANFRAGPGLNYDIVGGDYYGARFPVTGRAHGTNRIWYQIMLADGQLVWISERVVNIVPSADSVPWLQDNPVTIPFVMDCGTIPPILYTGASGQVIYNGSIALQESAGYGKAIVGYVNYGDQFYVVDGPDCTRLSEGSYQIEWLVQTGTGVRGYLREYWRNDSGRIDTYVALSPSANAFVPDAVPDPSASLTIGMQAQVYVTDDGLRLRSGPGVSFGELEKMPSGTIVTVIDGPAYSGGYTWWFVRSPSGREGWAVEAADGIQTLVPIASATGDGRPPQVANWHIEQVLEIQRLVATRQMSRKEAEYRLDDIVLEIGTDGLAWITRRAPVYDGQSGHWLSFGQYADDMVDASEVDPNTRFAQDPVGTATDLMFGDYDSADDLVDWFGLKG